MSASQGLNGDALRLTQFATPLLHPLRASTCVYISIGARITSHIDLLALDSYESISGGANFQDSIFGGSILGDSILQESILHHTN